VPLFLFSYFSAVRLVDTPRGLCLSLFAKVTITATLARTFKNVHDEEPGERYERGQVSRHAASERATHILVRGGTGGLGEVAPSVF
jgi:hypothetical protein